MEKIKCATIKYRLKDDPETDRFVDSCNHAWCIESLAAADLPVIKRIPKYEEQGFTTTFNRFVDRREALEIAKNAGQVSSTYNKNELFSEFVNKYYLY